MRVLMFGWEFPPHISGGLGTACYGLTKALIRQGVEVIFVVPKAFGDEDNEIRIVNASDFEINLEDQSTVELWKRLKYIQVASKIIPYISPEYYTQEYEKLIKEEIPQNEFFKQKYQFAGTYGPNLMYEVSRYALIASALAATNDFDVIHAHDWLTYPAGIAAKNTSGKPLVVHVHATEFDRSGENINQDVYNIEREGMMQADKVITVSNYTRNIVITRYGINPDKVFTIYNGADAFKFNTRPKVQKPYKEKVVTYIGRITFQKGPEYFVETARKLIQYDDNVRFVMAGSGDMFPRIIRLAARYRIGHKVHFTGFLKGPEVEEVLSYSDVYVMPSVSEPFGISPLEALMSNIPIVISKQSGVAEVLKHAIKVDFWDIDAMANAIYGILHYPGINKMFQKYSKAEVDQLKWDNSAFEVKQLYESLLREYLILK